MITIRSSSMPRRDKARFSILPTIVHPRQVSARENAFGVSKVESALGELAGTEPTPETRALFHSLDSGPIN